MILTLTRESIAAILQAEPLLEPGGWLQHLPDQKVPPDTATCPACVVGAVVRKLLKPGQKDWRERIQAVSAAAVASPIAPSDPRFLIDPGEWSLEVEEIHRRALRIILEKPFRALSWAYESLARQYGIDHFSQLTAENLWEMRCLAIELVRDSFPETVKIEIPDEFEVADSEFGVTSWWLEKADNK